MVLKVSQCLLPEIYTSEYLLHLPPVASLPFHACTTSAVDLSPHLLILNDLQRLENNPYKAYFSFTVSSPFISLIGALLWHLGPSTPDTFCGQPAAVWDVEQRVLLTGADYAEGRSSPLSPHSLTQTHSTIRAPSAPKAPLLPNLLFLFLDLGRGFSEHGSSDDLVRVLL